MTNILSTLRGSGIFCVKLVRNTSKLLSRILNFYNSNAVDVDVDSDPVDEGFGVDDVADDPRVARNERQIHELDFRGRHHKISILISTQRYRSIAPQIRTQCTALFVFRLRSQAELDAVLEEVSATYDKKTVAGFYREATEEPFSFLYIRLEAKKVEDMFWERFEYRLLP